MIPPCALSLSSAVGAGAVLAQVDPPPLSFTPMTWAAFVLANAIILAILGPRLLRDLRKR